MMYYLIYPNYQVFYVVIFYGVLLQLVSERCKNRLFFFMRVALILLKEKHKPMKQGKIIIMGRMVLHFFLL